MNLSALFLLLNQKGFYYFEGKTNSDGYFEIEFSTLHNGRGNSFKLIIDNEIMSIDYTIDHKSYVMKNVNQTTITNIILEDL